MYSAYHNLLIDILKFVFHVVIIIHLVSTLQYKCVVL